VTGKARLPANAAPVVVFAATTATALLAAPAIASQLASQFGLPPSQVGLYFTVEQAGMCLASIPAAWWLTRVPWRRVAAVALGLFIAANLLSVQAQDFATLLPLRAVSSLSGGTLMVLSMTLAGRSAERERLFALWTMGQLVVGATLLFLLPSAFATFGLALLYALIAVLAAGNLLLLRQLPAQVETRPHAERGAAGESKPGGRRSDLPVRSMVFGVVGVLFYYIGFGGLWPFLGAIAQAGGAQAIAGGTVLGLAGLAGLGGAVVAATLARKDGQQGGRGTLVVGYAIHAVGLLALVHEPALARFVVAACLLKGASNFTLPFILGHTARLDRDGRLMGFTNMAIGGGLAIGPLITGRLIEATGGLAALIALTFAWLAASALLVLSIGSRRARPAATPLAVPGIAKA
jgi:predicted MFS family arabinose efflux permease